jgi:prevent-host-death family protein
MTRIISASDAQKRFGEIVDAALSEPVMVQRHGRDVITMISVGEYRRLRRLERDALAAGEVDDETASLIAAAQYNA